MTINRESKVRFKTEDLRSLSTELENNLTSVFGVCVTSEELEAIMDLMICSIKKEYSLHYHRISIINEKPQAAA